MTNSFVLKNAGDALAFMQWLWRIDSGCSTFMRNLVAASVTVTTNSVALFAVLFSSALKLSKL